MPDPSQPDGEFPQIPLVFRIQGGIFAGIGIAVLGFLWGSDWNGFGSPPLFFRVFGSFIALSFVTMGGAAFLGKLTPRSNASGLARLLQELQGHKGNPASKSPSASQGGANFQCPNCSAALGTGADVSPHGDCKCPHCGKWFNIHRTPA